MLRPEYLHVCQIELMRLSLSFIALLLALSLQAQDILGSWSGVLNVQGIKLPLVLNIEDSDDGLTATLDSPDQGAFDIPTASVTFEENKLNVSIPTINATYEGTLQDDGSFDGDFVQFGSSYPLFCSSISSIEISLSSSLSLKNCFS